MKAKYLLLLSACVFPILAFSVAGNANGFETTANVGFVSEYSFRGIAQSNENPALQGGFDVEHDSGFYAGVWGSNINFGQTDGASLEVDAYGGFATEFSGLNVDLGVIHYMYPGANSGTNYDFTEYTVSLGKDFGSFSTSLSLNYSPEFFGDSGHAEYYAFGIDVPVTESLVLSGHIGRQNIEDEATFGVPDYTDWSIGASYGWAGFDFGLKYIDTDLKETAAECADGCDAKVIASVSRSF